MNTRFSAGLFQDPQEHTYEVAASLRGQGWTAYRVDEIVQRTDSNSGPTQQIWRAKAGHKKLTIELWATFTPLVIDMPPPPSAEQMRALNRVVSGESPLPKEEDDGAQAA